VGSRNLSPAGRRAPEAVGDATGGGGTLGAAGSRRRPRPGGAVVGVAGGDEPEPPVAVPGQAS
jgi:hypothetical protein